VGEKEKREREDGKRTRQTCNDSPTMRQAVHRRDGRSPEEVRSRGDWGPDPELADRDVLRAGAAKPRPKP